MVVDANVAVKWLLREPYSDEAYRLLDRWREAGLVLLAPGLLAYEVTNVLRRRVRNDELTVERAVGLLRALFDFELTLRHERGLHDRAVEIAHGLAQAASYDAHYLALAERERCECWTADERLWRAAREHFPFVRWIGEVSLQTPA